MRRNAVATFAANLVQYLDVREEVPVLWLKEAEYIAYFQRKQNLSMEAATDKWKRDKANSQIARRGEGEQLRLAVEAPPCTIATRGRRLERAIQSSAPVFNQGDLQRQLGEVTGFGHADTFLTGQFGSAADVLRTGAIASTSERPTSAANAFAVQDDGAPGQATNVEAVMPTGLIPEDTPMPHPSRHLARTRSEEVEDPEAKKPRKNRSGVAGELAEGRKAALERIKTILSEYGPAKVNQSKMVTQFYTKRKMDNPVGTKCVDYTNGLAELKKSRKT